MTPLATPFPAYAPVAATVLSRAFAPASHRLATAKLRRLTPTRAVRRVKLPVAVVRPDDGTTCLRAVSAADEALRMAVGRTLAQRVVDAVAAAFRF